MLPNDATAASSDVPRRVLLCHNFYREPGGEDQVFSDEGLLLESHGHEVIRYTRHNDDIAGMGRWEAARRTLWNRQTVDEIRRLIRQAQPEVLHCHNTFPLISPSIYQAANEAGVPVVQTLHNYRLLCPSALFLRDGRPCEDCLGKLLAWPGIVHGCYRRDRAATAVVAAMLAMQRLRGTWVGHHVPMVGVQQFIALSEFSRCKFVAGGLPADRITTKPNFMGDDPGAGPGRGGYALFVGRLSSEKGTAVLLEAWRQLDDAMRLKIVGDGPLADEIRAAARSDPRVEFVGRRTPAEVLPILGDAACLIVPSIWYENCPKAVLESYAKGTPVIGSRLGALPEMIDDGRTGRLFEPGNSADLARVVRECTGNGALAPMRRAAREQYVRKYAAAGNYAALMDIYRRTLGLHKAGPPQAACRETDARVPIGAGIEVQQAMPSTKLPRFFARATRG